MMHPDTELRPIAESIGLGVVATRPIPKGTVVWALDDLDLRLSPERLAELGPSYAPIVRHFSYRDASGRSVICWDLGRWINHSCEPNVLSTCWEFDVAVRDIAAGEEITNDYSTLNLEYDLDCLCAAPTCRGVIRASDFEDLADSMDQQVQESLRQSAMVPQALQEFLEFPGLLSLASRDPGVLRSIRQHRYIGEVSRTG